MQVNLYTGPNCCLCDDAKAVIDELPIQVKPDVEIVNIRANSDHYHKYATRIPVIQRTDNLQELNWPFTPHQLTEFLQ